MTLMARWLLSLFILALLPAGVSSAKTATELMGADLWNEALAARSTHADAIDNDKYMIVIDYRQHSSEKRFYLVNLETLSTSSMLVSHGRGSDPDHDGIADTFSNRNGSKMTSLGTFVTAESYYGKHGLSLRLDGLDKQNSAARERAIVIHGADYVGPGRRKIGRSWGCPALERRVAERIIPLITGGVMVYARGPDEAVG